MAAKKQKPKRPYKALIESLRLAWKVEHVTDDSCIWCQGQAEQAAFSAESLRVAVWNLCKGAGGILFEHDYRSLCYRSDLILTQEALLSQRSLSLFAERGFQSIHAASYKRRDGLRDGVMTVSRVPALEPISRVICKYPEPIFKTPKVALVKFFPVAAFAKPLMVINVHATLIRSKAVAVEEMEHLIASVPTYDGPILLAGDFNTFTYGYLSAIKNVLSRIGLEHVPIPSDPRPNNQALDQVFVKGLNVKRIIVDTTVKNSDHFPLLLELSFDGVTGEASIDL